MTEPPNNAMQLTTAGWSRLRAPSSARAAVNQGEVVRPSQLIASVRQAIEDRGARNVPTDAGLRDQWLTASAVILAK